MDRGRATVSRAAEWACGGNSGTSDSRLRAWLLIQYCFPFISGTLGAKDGWNVLV